MPHSNNDPSQQAGDSPNNPANSSAGDSAGVHLKMVSPNSRHMSGRLLLSGKFLSYFSLLIGLVLLSMLGSSLSLFDTGSGGTWLWSSLSLAYTVLAVPALAYITFRWFFLHTEVWLKTASAQEIVVAENNSSSVLQQNPLRKDFELGAVTLTGSFGNFLVAYFLSFGVLVFTLGIGFPYYVYEQKAWFFKNTLITFRSSGRRARLTLAPNFKAYFFKSWGFVLLWVGGVIVIPLALLSAWFSGAFWSGIFSIILIVLIVALMVMYYFYWSMKWLLVHTRFIFLSDPNIPTSAHDAPTRTAVNSNLPPSTTTLPPPSHPPSPTNPAEVTTTASAQHSIHSNATTQQNLHTDRPAARGYKHFVFTGNFFQYLVNSLFFALVSIATLGLGVVFYAYWFGRWFINHTEIHG
ncbi:hypothetical protein COTS27_00147 [Spirochaetota bacterium]|nr:hypothetical protein COTS27_00147 [Spirochaetota bacterium]